MKYRAIFFLSILVIFGVYTTETKAGILPKIGYYGELVGTWQTTIKMTAKDLQSNGGFVVPAGFDMKLETKYHQRFFDNDTYKLAGYITLRLTNLKDSSQFVKLNFKVSETGKWDYNYGSQIISLVTVDSQISPIYRRTRKIVESSPKLMEWMKVLEDETTELKVKWMGKFKKDRGDSSIEIVTHPNIDIRMSKVGTKWASDMFCFQWREENICML